MNFGKALYFPYIHFQDENWLKYTLLYWDGVKRIVPPTYSPKDSESVKELIGAGVIESVDPTSGDRPYTLGAAEEFIPTLEELMKTRGHLGRGAIVATNVESNAQEASVHVKKMDSRVAKMLVDSNLARDYGDWYSMDGALAGYYMLCLAAHISEKQHAPMLSDSFEMETGGTYFQHSRPDDPLAAAADDTAGFTLARMVMPVPSPNNLASLSMKKVLDFHKAHQAERMQFRQAIETLTKDAAGLDDKTAIRDLLEQQKKTILNALNDQTKAMDEFGVGTVASLMAVSVPSGVLVSGLSHFDPIIASVGTGVALALSFVGWAAKTRQAKRKAVRDSDWHYLLQLKDTFSTKSVASEARKSFFDFIHD